MFILNEKNKKTYEFIKSTYVDEYNVEFVELRHIKTKAKVVLLVSDDENRVFNIAFKTPVNNGKGTPHILEHSVLCGSRKYNVKDPFVELAKSSINTFLNAMTFPDKTCYPVASVNLKDFHNLMDVYLDAVFYPNAVTNKKIFMQEGWHYEVEGDKKDLKVNGVVLNEMKGVYSDPDGILESNIMSTVFEGTNYSYESGGNPDDIIDLSFDEFVDFHKKYYSPSNSIIYYYGKLDYNYELESLENNYLKEFSYIEVEANIGEAPNLKKDRENYSYYNIDNDDTKDKAYIAYNFAIKDKEALDYIVISILDYILFSPVSGLLKNKFLDMGLGESINTFWEYGLKTPIYSIISQNIDEKKKDKFREVLLDTINDLLQNGIDIDKLKAGINTQYFQLAEGEFSSMPKGLVLTLNSLETYLYGEDVCSLLQYKEIFQYLNKIDLSDKNNIFYKVLKKVFIDNELRSISILLPKKGYLKEKEEAIRNILDERKKKLSDDDLLKIENEEKELKLYQSTKDSIEAIKSIPSLKIDDLEDSHKFIDYVIEDIESVDTLITYDNDRDVVYFGLSFDMANISREELYLYSIISHLLQKIDLKSMQYQDLNSYIDKNIGGFRTSIEEYDGNVKFTFSAKALYDKSMFCFDIMSKLLGESVFVDTDRINMLINEVKVDSEVSILSSGHIAAMNRAGVNIDLSSSIKDKIRITGIAHYRFLNEFLKKYKENSSLFNETFTLLYKKLYTKKVFFDVSMNKKYYNEVVRAFKDFNKMFILTKMRNIFTEIDEEKLNENLNKIRNIIKFDDFEKTEKKEAIVTSGDVNFVALANNYDKENFSGKVVFLKTLFNYEYLWTNIRVLGGAYGCMSAFTRNARYFFGSYRDPNLLKTMDTYYGIYEYLKKSDIPTETLERYVIGAAAIYEKPISIVERHKLNVFSYYTNLTDEMYNKERFELIHIKKEDIDSLSNIFNNIKESEACAIISEKSLKEAEKEFGKIWRLTS